MMSTAQQRLTKSVSFSETAKMRLTLHINDYTDDEFDACYYSRSDYSEFKGDIKRTARMMEMKRQIDENMFCTRGLESRTRAGRKTRSMNRKASVCAVLIEQMQQVRSKDFDDEKIGAMYTPFARNSATAAYLLGIEDEMIVREHEEKVLDRPSQNIASQVLKLRGSEATFEIRRQTVYNSAA